MPAFSRFFALAALIVAVNGVCDNAKFVSKTTFNGVDFTTLECPSEIVKRTTDPNAESVCGAPCVFNCFHNVGDLPPTSQDCAVINNAVEIFSGKSSATFTVSPNHVQTLTFGTCAYFFQNLDSVPLTYCWSDLATNANASAATCFPPSSPPSSDATCGDAVAGQWVVG
ncbi:hypothetical protein K488DRAFT_87145 [Vararia minispora EC-137]|uniref:Uncharacterized protein n=1 Tax=Vararia minispora EC-137 TaxID=1314806 RepID=A0ACB8QHI4_9AGAM|nr:hypothetical protein K488DRAFT_87145 [Vararia minispora EC-137]